MLTVIAYDIADDRRRARLHTLLLGYGDAVQESVFECDLTETQLRAVRRAVARLIRPRDDKVRFYLLCADCALRVEEAPGRPRPPTPRVEII